MSKPRKDLCADALIRNIRSSFDSFQDFRKMPKFSMSDILMSGYAIFSLKHKSLLAFEKNARMGKVETKNMKSLFGVDDVPSDTRIREVIDPIEPDNFRPVFKNLFSVLQRGKVLEQYNYIDNKYLISVDGTGLFSSKEVKCENCMTKESKKTGEITYYHQMLGLVMVHPDIKAVVPFHPEAIAKIDGETKNDCERNAAKRALKRLRKDHPKLNAIIIEDGLSSNAPHIQMLIENKFSYILGAKPGDHKFLFEQADLAGSELYFEVDDEKHIHKFKFINDISLNETNIDLKINFLRYEQFTKKTNKTLTMSWVTDIELTLDNVYKIMRGARARWKIENETFNTLKNQGYEFEHNYGHGNKYLCTNFAILMFLAFFVDQIQKITCKYYQLARERTHTFYGYCHSVLFSFKTFLIPDWLSLLKYISKPTGIPLPAPP